MRIIIYGALGSVGTRLVAEALLRGHDVTAVVRRESQLSSLPPGVHGRVGNAANIDQVAEFSADQDVIISATRPSAGSEQDLVAAATALLAGAARSGTRLILVGGAARLKVPETGGPVIDDPRFVPAAVQDIASACMKQFEVCAGDREADWAYASPPPLLVPGERTGDYRLGGDELLLNSDGQSTVSIEDFAVALLDEAEAPKHRRAAFAVAGPVFAVSENDVLVETPDGQADCYFVHPSSGAHPGIVIWPDALGLRPAMRTAGKRLAGAGYSVVVVNPYYRQVSAPIGVTGEAFKEPEVREQVMALARSVTPDMTVADAAALVRFLDQQKVVDSNRKLGVLGYCMGGTKALRTAAAQSARVGALASFHGSRLATGEPSSPHLRIPETSAAALLAIAEQDDEKDPRVKEALRASYAAAGLRAEIEVFPGTMHGWCVADVATYNRRPAEEAWNRMLHLFSEALG